MEWYIDMGDHITTYFFSYHLICIGVLLFYNDKDRSARVCLPEISFAQLGQRWGMPL